MIFRGETGTTDWAWGRGKQSYLTGNNAIMRSIETRLLTFYSECFFFPETGVPWFTLLGTKDETTLLLTLRQEILDCYGVLRVNDIQYQLDENRQAIIRYWVDTMYSTSVSGTVTL